MEKHALDYDVDLMIGPLAARSFDTLDSAPYTHPHHFDHMLTRQDLHVVELDGTRWPIAVVSSSVTVTPPLAGGSIAGLPALVTALREGEKKVHLLGFTPSEVRSLPLALTHEVRLTYPFRIIQTLKPAKHYAKMARRGRGVYTVRELKRADTADMIGLRNRWALEKRKAYLARIEAASDPFNPRSEEILRSADHLAGAVSPQSPVQLGYDLEHAYTRHFGAYNGDTLFAHVALLVGDEITAVHDRNGTRTRPSPQEFLDARVFEILASEGLERIDRGYSDLHPSERGLLTYKAKFGELEFRYEPRFENVFAYAEGLEHAPLNARMRVHT